MKATVMKLSRLWITGFFCFQLIACAAWASPKTSENPSVTVHSGSSETRLEAAGAGDPAATGNAGEGGDVNVTAQDPAAGDGDPIGPDRDLNSLEEDTQSYEPVIMVIDNEADAIDVSRSVDSDTEKEDDLNDSGNIGTVSETSAVSDTNGLVLNFDNADLVEVIRTFAELLEINYMLEAGVGGKVTIHTAGKLDRSDLFPVFYQILQTHGLTAVKQNNIYKIMPARDAVRLPIPSRTGTGLAPMSPENQMMVQIIPLQSISAGEMSKVLTPFISADGTIVAIENVNILMVVDKFYNIERVLRLIDVFDADIFDQVHYRFYPLEYADAASVAEILGKMLVSYGPAIQSAANLIPVERLNMLLVISRKPNIFNYINEFIEQYDIPSLSTEQGIYVYPVRNGQAADIASLLGSVFSGKQAADSRGKPTPSSRNPLSRSTPDGQAAEPAAPQQTIGVEVAVGTSALRGEVNITADEYRNSLIIEATPADYLMIKKLLTQLDVLPRQVLIEVTIAEITLDDKSDMGVEWSYVKGDASMSTSLLNATMGSGGLQYSIGNPDRWKATMSALATKNKVNILSSPTILASNSKSARIDISTEVPVASSTYSYGADRDDVLSTNIQYRDTGVMLSVTPHINEMGLVTMEITQEVSEQAESVQVANQSYPSFFKRSADTTLTVQSGQTIVIGGLIRETKSKGSSGMPWVVSVPVLNFLFGKTSDTFSKTELIIMISPYVITRLDDIDAVTADFKQKVGSLFEHNDRDPR
ncbi:MAG: type II secretion system protein GspD [Desulfobacteraceae bacterium]|jgi:general secretion pathway protein D|nr:MAG: type II secretion system protein GspD [Desulfobacteraceae bacterium]